MSTSSNVTRRKKKSSRPEKQANEQSRTLEKKKKKKKKDVDAKRHDPLPSIDDMRADPRRARHHPRRRHLRPTCCSMLARRSLFERLAGLHGGMEFTYRDPQRSTDPVRSVVGRPFGHRRCQAVSDR